MVLKVIGKYKIIYLKTPYRKYSYKIFSLQVWMFCYMDNYTPYLGSVLGDQKRTSDPLELELPTTMSCNVGAEDGRNLAPLEEQLVFLNTGLSL